MVKFIRICGNTGNLDLFRIVVYFEDNNRLLFKYLDIDGSLHRGPYDKTYNSYRYAVSTMKKYYPKFTKKRDESSMTIKEVQFTCGL